jgi:hypothetical protein
MITYDLLFLPPLGRIEIASVAKFARKYRPQLRGTLWHQWKCDHTPGQVVQVIMDARSAHDRLEYLLIARMPNNRFLPYSNRELTPDLAAALSGRKSNKALDASLARYESALMRRSHHLGL